LTCVVGADGCPDGWLAVAMPPGRPGAATACILSAAADLPGLGAPVAIDIPIGLMDTPKDGRRPPDVAARAVLNRLNTGRLAGVASRVFATPSRAHLEQFRRDRDYAALRRAFPPPRSLSKQAWFICGKIDELDRLCRRDPGGPIWESHPEVAFAHLAGRTLPPKKRPEGRAARTELLAREGFRLPALAASLAASGRRWAADDLLDAAALALVAARIARGAHAGLPDLAGRDGLGLRRVIVY
jgi:predicted RNase H-like nuclease